MQEDPNDVERSALAAARMARVLELPDRARLKLLIDAMAPGSRLLSVRRLRGGITSRASAIRYQTSEGDVRDAVLRIATPGSYTAGPEHFEREMKTLRALEPAEVPTPRPLLVDAAGEYFGMASIVVSLLPGRGLATPVRKGIFLDDLARALAQVHFVSLSGADLAHLETRRESHVREKLSRAASTELVDAPRGAEVLHRLQGLVDRVRWLEPCLTHQDYWPGNTLWFRGRLTGVIDWTNAAVGDPRIDVAQCRVDLAMMYGIDWADQFARRYEEASGCRLGGLTFWDLYVAQDALVSLPFYLTGYQDLGLKRLTLPELRRRLNDFIDSAVSRLDS